MTFSGRLSPCRPTLFAGACDVFVLSANSFAAIGCGLTAAPGELPMWVPLAMTTSAAAMLSVANVRGRPERELNGSPFVRFHVHNDRLHLWQLAVDRPRDRAAQGVCIPQAQRWIRLHVNDSAV
jgi:hypothetical protein